MRDGRDPNGEVAVDKPPLLERAFQIARNGAVTSVDDIQRKLGAEGYANVASHFASPSLRKQLKALIVERTTTG